MLLRCPQAQFEAKGACVCVYVCVLVRVRVRVRVQEIVGHAL